MSARKAAQGSETKTRELLGGLEENSISLTIGSLICPPGKSMIFYPSGSLIFDCSSIYVIKTVSFFIQWSRLLRHLSTETESSTLSLPLNDGNLSNDSTFVRFVNDKFSITFWLFMCTRGLSVQLTPRQGLASLTSPFLPKLTLRGKGWYRVQGTCSFKRVFVSALDKSFESNRLDR